MKNSPSTSDPPEASLSTALDILSQVLIERRLAPEDIIGIALELSPMASLDEIAERFAAHGIRLESQWRECSQEGLHSNRVHRLQKFVNILRAKQVTPDRHGVLLLVVGRLEPALQDELEVWLKTRGQL